MLTRIKLRTKLLLLGTVLTLLPLLVVAVFTVIQNRRTLNISKDVSLGLAYADLDHIAAGVYGLLETQQDLLDKTMQSYLNVAREVVTIGGGISFGTQTASWQAMNQYTKAPLSIDLPRMQVGDVWFGQIHKIDGVVPVVDKVQVLTQGATCTVFQRMNGTGDMLRVATNVIKKDGTRAIGTYIPAFNPDGKPNPVISTVLKGDTFTGRAFVVNTWYNTAYEPIHDHHGDIVGVLYVGIPQESVVSLRQTIMDIKVGDTGYVYILDSQGHYVISKDGKRDGELIWGAKDSQGNLFIQEIVRKALALERGEIDEQRYPWKNAGESEARLKVARLMYFKPWDWIIGVGSYEDEFLRATHFIENTSAAGNRFMLGLMVLSLAAAVFTWVLISKGITRPIKRIASGLLEGAGHVSSGAGEVSASSQNLAQGASEEAHNVEKTSLELKEMTLVSKQTSQLSRGAESLMQENIEKSAQSLKSLVELTQKMSKIEADSDEIGQIINNIDEIAFQTNLLALNAAVEAARAGEAGAGFAVVASEVKRLAQRTTEAARNTQLLLDATIERVSESTQSIRAINDDFEGIIESATVMGEKIYSITKASRQQADGIGQISKNTLILDEVARQTAAGSEESAAAAEELSGQALEMKRFVSQLVALVDGGSARGGAAGDRSGTQAAEAPAGHSLVRATTPVLENPETV